MQRLLNKLSSRYEAEEKLMTRENSLVPEASWRYLSCFKWLFNMAF